MGFLGLENKNMKLEDEREEVNHAWCRRKRIELHPLPPAIRLERKVNPMTLMSWRFRKDKRKGILRLVRRSLWDLWT